MPEIIQSPHPGDFTHEAFHHQIGRAKRRELHRFAAVTCISNPVRYRSRYDLYHRFARDFAEAGVPLYTVEMAFGDRPFMVTERDNNRHLQVRCADELWHKENMLNLGINFAIQMNPDVKYIAWIDADVIPMRPVREWVEETIEQLQHYEVVQMFKHAQDLDPHGNMIGPPAVSFMARYLESGCKPPNRGGFWSSYYDKEHGHPGYAWAANRNALDKLGLAMGGGPLIDFAILGAADRHMALGLVGCMEQSFEHLNDEYRAALLQWQIRAERWIRRDVGFVPGSLYHYWHGKKRDRGYSDRWKILKGNNFNPLTDLTRDSQGLLRLETYDPRQIRLRDEIRFYFRSRNEDSIDL
jgi:hypothetical protein